MDRDEKERKEEEEAEGQAVGWFKCDFGAYGTGLEWDSGMGRACVKCVWAARESEGSPWEPRMPRTASLAA